MTIIDALILGVFQGITEFLPISSSGHLVLVESYLQLPVEDLMAFDVAVHFGTLLAIFLYFWKDFADLLQAFGFSIYQFAYKWRVVYKWRGDSGKKVLLVDEKILKNQKLIIGLIVGTIPAVVIGLLFNDYLEENFRSVSTVAVMMLIVAVYFIIAEIIKKRRNPGKLGLLQIFIIGVAQAFALIPGVSRSGSTIATGLALGIDRHEAARFSFLLGSVAITAATLLSLYKVFMGEFSLPHTEVLLVGITSSFVSGYASVSLLMRFLKKHTLYVFAVYLILLGLGLLTII